MKNMLSVLVVLVIISASLFPTNAYGYETHSGSEINETIEEITVCALTSIMKYSTVESKMFTLSADFFDSIYAPWCDSVWDIGVSFCIGIGCVVEFEGECTTGGEHQCPGFSPFCESEEDFPSWPWQD
jgi:hypothetical protein